MFDFDFFKIKESYKNVQKSCSASTASSFLLDEACVLDIFSKLDENNTQAFLHYLQSRIIKQDIIAFNAYKFLAIDQFISLSKIVENDALEQRFDAIHANSVEEALIMLNAENILNGAHAEVVHSFNQLDKLSDMLDDCNCVNHAGESAMLG